MQPDATASPGAKACDASDTLKRRKSLTDLSSMMPPFVESYLMVSKEFLETPIWKGRWGIIKGCTHGLTLAQRCLHV